MYSAVVAAVRSESGWGVCPHALARLLETDLVGLSSVARVSEHDFSSCPHSWSVQEALAEIVRVLVAAEDLTSGADAPARAAAWFRNCPISGFGGTTPMELVSKGRSDAVLYHLAVLSEGGYA
jgi:hypothetical protein